MYDYPESRLIRAEAVFLETIAKLVWIVSLLYGAELFLSFYIGDFNLLNRGNYNTIVIALIILAIFFRVIGLVDKHLMEYWERKVGNTR